MTRRCRSAGLLLAALCWLVPATAGAEIIERVVAVVNDEAILLSDLRRRAAPYLQQIIANAESQVERTKRIKQLYSQILGSLVDEQLVQQIARKMHVSVSTNEVAAAIDNVMRQNNLTEDQFWQAVRSQGFTEKQYKGDVRKQLLRLKVINQRVRSRVNITEDTVRETYEDRVRTARRSQRFRAAHVFRPLPEDASATVVADAIRQARELRGKLTEDNFEEFASGGGGELGWLDQGDLPDVLEEALLGLDAGQISQPVRGPAGVHIFLLRERQQGDATIPSYEDARAEIQRELVDKAMQRQEELFITGLRRDAIIDLRN
jgi:peptidyl-prolyl cis-trans isomerase SurA